MLPWRMTPSAYAPYEEQDQDTHKSEDPYIRLGQPITSVEWKIARKWVSWSFAPYLTELRRRLGDLSWLMRCLAEPIARRANAEDRCRGRFWEGRYKCQLLCDTRAVLPAMTYVDLNPIRAGMATRLEDSDHTSAQQRIEHAKRDPSTLMQSLLPTSGSLLRCLPIRAGEYLELVDGTGRQLRDGKRGGIHKDVPPILQSLDPKSRRWIVRVNAVGSGYWRVVGEAQDLIAVAQGIGQRWVKGLGLAKKIARPSDRGWKRRGPRGRMLRG
jgi:hypothetical protein